MGFFSGIKAAFNGVLGIADAFGSTPDFIRTVGGDGNRFRPLGYRDIERLISKYTWRQLLSRGRYIYQNSGMVSGAIHDKSNYVIGDSWRFVYTGENHEWGEIAEQTMNEWQGISDTRGQPYDLLKDLHLGCTSIDRDGDFFALLTYTNKGYPQIQIIPSHRIGSREMASMSYVVGGRYDGAVIVNGVIYNSNWRPIAYRYMDLDPANDADIPANNIVPFFDPMWFGQGRGIPCITASLADFDDVFEIREAEKMAIEIGSSTAVLEYNQSGRVDESAAYINRARVGDNLNEMGRKNRDLLYEVREKGQIRYFKAGTGQKLEMFQPNRPGEQFIQFADHILRGAFMGIGWPIEWCYSPEKLGGPAGRIIVDRIKRTVRQRQDVMYPGVKRILLWAIAKHQALDLLPPCDDWYKWDIAYPAQPSIDNNYDSANERADYLLGLNNLKSSYARRGMNWKKEVNQKMDETEYIMKEAEKRKIPFASIIQLTPNGTSPSENENTNNENANDKATTASGDGGQDRNTNK